MDSMTMRLLSFAFSAALAVARPLPAQTADLGAGIALYNARRWSEADAFFASAAKAQPRSADAALWYGKTLLAEDRADDAEDWLSKAATLAPRSSECQLWLARAIGVQAQRANILRQPFLARRVKTTVDRAIELDADNIDARELRWQFYVMAPGVMGGSDEKARVEAAEILRRNPYRGGMIAVNAAGRTKDKAAAERALRSMATEFPDSLAPVSSFAAWLADNGRVPEAFALVETYQKRRPADPSALYQIGAATRPRRRGVAALPETGADAGAGRSIAQQCALPARGHRRTSRRQGGGARRVRVGAVARSSQRAGTPRAWPFPGPA